MGLEDMKETCDQCDPFIKENMKLKEEIKKLRDKLCKKRGWDNGPGHCEGVAFCDGFSACYAIMQKRIKQLEEHLGERNKSDIEL